MVHRHFGAICHEVAVREGVHEIYARRKEEGTKESGNTRLLIVVSPVPQGSWGWAMTNDGIHYS